MSRRQHEGSALARAPAVGPHPAKRGRVPRRAIAFGIAALAASLAPLPARTQAPALEDFAGTFVLAGDRRELWAMDDAINRVVDRMNLFIREIARGEIRRHIEPERRIRFAMAGADTLSLSLDAWGPVQVRVGAPPIRTRGSNGEEVALTLRYAGGRLVQRSATPRGARTNVFALSSDRERLAMSVRITSDQLPADIRYRLTYRRAN